MQRELLLQLHLAAVRMHRKKCICIVLRQSVGRGQAVGRIAKRELRVHPNQAVGGAFLYFLSAFSNASAHF